MKAWIFLFIIFFSFVSDSFSFNSYGPYSLQVTGSVSSIVGIDRYYFNIYSQGSGGANNYQLGCSNSSDIYTFDVLAYSFGSLWGYSGYTSNILFPSVFRLGRQNSVCDLVSGGFSVPVSNVFYTSPGYVYTASDSFPPYVVNISYPDITSIANDIRFNCLSDLNVDNFGRLKSNGGYVLIEFVNRYDTLSSSFLQGSSAFRCFSYVPSFQVGSGIGFYAKGGGQYGRGGGSMTKGSSSVASGGVGVGGVTLDTSAKGIGGFEIIQ